MSVQVFGQGQVVTTFTALLFKELRVYISYGSPAQIHDALARLEAEHKRVVAELQARLAAAGESHKILASPPA